jgi:hypothetical protein
MTNYIVTVKIKIDPQQYIDSRYDEYKKSVESGKSTTEANLSPPNEAEIKLFVRKLVVDRFSLDNEIKNVYVAEVSQEEESNRK